MKPLIVISGYHFLQRRGSMCQITGPQAPIIKGIPMRQKRIYIVLLFVLIPLLSTTAPMVIAAQPEQTIIVTSTADSGPGTLREALERASSGTTITFDQSIFPLSNPATITVTSNDLPAIDQGNLTIDASSAGVILDGSELVEGRGLTIESDGNVIKGLQILHFPGHAIVIAQAANNKIGGSNATPGGPCTGDCNLLSGNGAGLSIQGERAVNNIVSGNHIDTDAIGKMGMGIQIHGIHIAGGTQDNLIGGDTEGERNLISGNLHSGVHISGGGTMNNIVRGNWIGLYIGGARQAFPSDMAISPNYSNDCTLFVATLTTGIHKSTDCGESWSESNTGLTVTRIRQVEIPPDATDGNTLYTLSEDGHLFISTDGAASWSLVSTSMQGFDYRNLAFSAEFGTDQTMYASAEGWSQEEYGGGPGVFKSSDGGMTWSRMVDGMTDNNIRKVIPSLDPAAKDNLIALTYSGIELSTDGGMSWTTPSIPDPGVGDLALSPTYASDQTIFISTHAGTIYRSNDGGVNWAGVEVLGGDPRSLTLSPNFNSDRTVCYFSDEGGNHIYCSIDGGSTWVKRDPLLTGHFQEWGSRIVFSPNYPSDGTVFFLSNAGLARSTDGGATWSMVRGLRDLGNVNGVSIEDGASHNTIGPGNVLSNNNSGVVLIGADTAHNIVIGNLVGTDPTGAFAQANSGGGIEIRGGHDNVIGGFTEVERNILSGNRAAGMWLGLPETRNNIVIGNYIGTDITGEKALGNGGEGGVVIIYGAQDNIVGRDTNGERNVISGNESDGVYIGGVDTKNNIVSGNYIGTDASGKKPLGNTNHGVSLNAGTGSNVIGPGNTIAFNLDGVAVIGQGSTGNTITQNSIYSNDEVSILNRDGGNNELTPPTITFVGTRGIRGTSQPNATIEVFSDEDDDGRIFEGSTNADGEGNFTFHMPAGRLTGPKVTTTATDPSGNSSPFSLPGSPPAPAVTRELPGIVAPTQVSIEPAVVGTNLGLALFSVLFFGLTSTLFNSILIDYRDELIGIFRKLLPRRFADSIGRAGPSIQSLIKRNWGRLLLLWLVVLFVTSTIESFLDPEISILGIDRLGMVATLFISAVVVGALELGSDLLAYKRFIPSMRAEGNIQWIGMVIAIACVILSRALEFRPGYLYGIVGAIYLMPNLTDSAKCGKRATLVLLTIFVGGLILWIATAFLPSSLTEIEPIFLTIFLISLQGVFFELFPLAITAGGDILNWRKGVWVVFFSIVFFCFYHFLLNPNASDVQALQQNGVQILLILIAVFGLGTFTLWLLFPFRLRRKKAEGDQRNSSGRSETVASSNKMRRRGGVSTTLADRNSVADDHHVRKRRNENEKMSKNIAIAFFTGLLIGSGYFFGTICRQIGQSYALLLSPSKELLVQFLWFLLAGGILLVFAGLVAALLRPKQFGFLAFGLAGVAMLLGWEITLFSGILILLFLVVGILYVVGVERELNERIKFSVRAISDEQGLLLIALILLASASLFRGVETYIEEEGITIPETYTELFMDQLEKRIEEQVPPEERQKAVAEFRAEFQRSMDEFIENTVQPYEQFIPLVIVTSIFMSLVTFTRFLTWIPIAIMNFTFRLLESVGVTKIVREETEVQRLVLS
jgi:photosystem II stability/assembly factor-like uncharacterized protein